MIYCPMSVLMSARVRDILIISIPTDTPRFKDLFGDGYQFGVKPSYAVQPSLRGLAQAFIIGEVFIANDTVAMVLGDNGFASHGVKKRLREAVENAESGSGATAFGYYVKTLERKCGKYLQVSTDEVYGALEGAEGYFMKTTSLSPHSPYLSSKASADYFVKAFRDTYGMPINITRCSNNHDPYQFTEKYIV